MDDFEYSVEISDRDWECFFAECEECNLRPPSLAGVDDSGMSDIDDTGSILAKRIQKVDLTAAFSVSERSVDGPPDCEGSPVEHYLSKLGVGGNEIILSGSEEDIHLQSVNMYFERLKNLREAERLAEPSQVKTGKKREAILEGGQCSDGQQSKSSTLPKNIPKSNSSPARGETAVGKDIMRAVDTIGNINTIKKVEPGSNISSEPAASNLVYKTKKSAYHNTELFIREEACTETGVNEVPQRNQSHDLPDGVHCSETTPHTDEGTKVEMCRPLKEGEQECLLPNLLSLSDTCDTNSPSNLEIVRNIKRKEEQNTAVLQFGAKSINKSASQEPSPSASVKRKRRKKRRLSCEPAETSHGYERQVLVKMSDSEEEQYATKGGTGLCLSDDVNLFHLNEPQKYIASSLNSVTSNIPMRISAKEIKANDLFHTISPCDSQYKYLPESIVRQGRCKATSSAEKITAIDRSLTSLSQSDDHEMSGASNSGNVVMNLKPCIKLPVEELTILNKNSWLPFSATASATGKSDMARDTANSGRKESLQQTDKVTHPVTGFENEQNLKGCTAEVKSIPHSIFPSVESNDPALEVSQNDKPSAAKSVLAVETGNSGRSNYTLCQREAEPRQQLDIDLQDTDQYSSTLEKTRGLNTKPQQFKTTACPFLEEISCKATCVELMSDCVNSSPDQRSLSKCPSILDINDTIQQTECPPEVQTSLSDILSEEDTTAERAQLSASQMMVGRNPCPSDKMNIIDSSLRETKLSMSEDSITNPSSITPVSSCCTLEYVNDTTESVMSPSDENIMDLSQSFCSSVCENEHEDQGEKTPLILAKQEEGDVKSGPENQSNDSTQSKCDLLDGVKDTITTSKADCEPKKAPDSKHSVFAMSSFWNEMEKLTINDILGLRMMSKAEAPFSLPPLQESEETGMFATSDSGFFTQLDESKPEQTSEFIPRAPDCVESSLGSVTAVESSSSRSVMWESEPVRASRGTDIYPENMMLTSGRDISLPLSSGSAPKNLRKISKNVSVHNLHALESESFSSTWKDQTLKTLNEGEESEGVENFSDEHKSKQDKDMDVLPSSLKDSNRISVMDIFQYLFGGKQSVPSQSAADNITTVYTDGNSVPETYDHFFSEFDTESFFSPLITAEDPAKDKLVPIFSYSHSANRNLEFPEAYDYFFQSSTSDDSSVESDQEHNCEEEDNCSPLRVVTRFSRKPSASQISTDIYENFFTDSDLRQNFFWKTTFSFRNVSFSGLTVQKQTLSNSLSHLPVRKSGRSLQRAVYPSNALGNQDMMFPDPLLYHLEDRILRQKAQRPFRYEDLQTAVSNPRLDASLLSLRQSDMCLVCIAFASWVLRTANPQIGDTWKAVLLANVSALSAIRYLRKYVKTEAADSEKKLHHLT